MKIQEEQIAYSGAYALQFEGEEHKLLDTIGAIAEEELRAEEFYATVQKSLARNALTRHDKEVQQAAKNVILAIADLKRLCAGARNRHVSH